MELGVKICGITKPEQGRAIASLGATALGFICVPNTPRYVSPQQIRAIVEQLPDETPCDRVGVFLNASVEDICQTVENANLNCVQLHGSESTRFCDDLRVAFPDVKLIKALRIRSIADLNQASIYEPWVDALLLDAYHPDQAGGTGRTIDWAMLKQFRPHCPWFLAGGLNPHNVLDALNLVSPDGIDLSSGVETAPGDKNLRQVAQLFQTLKDSKHENTTICD
ncbi:phosphoribosylanthranilate isomerase [Myxacorys almedinensis]|uniref:N-(5'-phosphoribosyl)anthranilate isomerase n=1 Tax=Myxacorys almedinensis A TaxID=2690445 RepID=A0A8J8CIC3_9CYAN|nr:phosphoribosylanthranilate isomerase [Myxacorys almedinensis]NDJ17598.1 phosphoribosylanthranilate isomerase [Myxacorys almedinensis A]